MNLTLRGRLVLLLGVVVSAACLVLVATALFGSALLLRREQDQAIASLASGLCEAVTNEAHEDRTDLPGGAKNHFAESPVAEYRCELLDPRANVVAASSPLSGWDPGAWSIPPSSSPSSPAPRADRGAHGRFRGQAVGCGEGMTLRVIAHDILFESPVRRAAGVLLAVIPIALGAGLLLGRIGIARALRPLNDLERAARRLNADSSPSLGVGTRPRELARLESSFDALLARLGEALARERRFTQEASHELRTPLTVLRARAEQCAATGVTPEQAEHLAVIVGEIDSLESLVAALLLLARSDDAPLPRDLVNLCDVVREAVRRQDWADAHEGRPIEVDGPDEILAHGSEELLGRAVGNLLENARKFAGATARIRIRVTADAGRGVITVDDDGPGIPDAVQPKVFDRFFRDPAHRHASTGAGLGLAVVRAIVVRHGGAVAAGRSELGGAAFRLEFPLS